MGLKFAIRDDDTSFFTRPDELRRPYEGIWNTVPISLSVVPFHGRTRSESLPPEYWSGGDQLYPLADNGELVSFLKTETTKKRLSVTMHGYSHVDEPDGHEFETGADLDRKAREGKKYLEEVLGVSVRAFVPPNNALSAAGYRAVTGAGLDIVQIVPFRPERRQLQLRHVPVLARVVVSRFVWKHAYPYYPHVLDFGDHREVAHYSLTPSVYFKRRLADLEFCHRRGGVYVLATHYWELEQKTKDGVTLRHAVRRLVERARELGAEFCSVNRLMGRE
jgi:predicted deacetylase